MLPMRKRMSRMFASGMAVRSWVMICCFWNVSSWTTVEFVTVTSSVPRRMRPGRV
jgi:hypothetical protein